MPWARTLPMDMVSIFLGVCEILTVLFSITGVEFPSSYLICLPWVNVLNFDMEYILSAPCVLPSVIFYEQLLARTITPFVIAGCLVLTYHLAN